MSDNGAILYQLSTEATSPVHDPLWGHINIPDRFIPILRSPSFMKLASIRQLGPTSLVYPGATHSRFNHSIGVYHVAYRFAQSILRKDRSQSFTLDGMRSFLLAALCHDLGHFPYTHSMKELPLRDHEALSGDLIQGPLAGFIRDAGLDPRDVALIVDKDAPCEDREINWYRSFLSGVLDPDKLDYLPRDAYFCGLPFGGQDIDFVLRNLEFDTRTGVGISSAGIRSIEHLLFSKYLLYRSVYWHPQVRMATGMVKKALWEAIKLGHIRGEDLYNLDDDGFFARMSRCEAPSCALVAMVQSGRLFQPACEIPIDALRHKEKELESLEGRTLLEQEIATLLGRESGTQIHAADILVDIPERISFEVHMPVHDGNEVIPYPDSQTVFTESLVENFTRSLRFVRIGLSPRIDTSMMKHRNLIMDFLDAGSR